MHATRKNWQNIKQALRDKYAWPGGYPLFIVLSDGGALSIDAARANYRRLCRAYITKDAYRDGWSALSAEINYEDQNLYCDQSGERIEPAYPADTEQEPA